jgi:hypothetical protein
LRVAAVKAGFAAAEFLAPSGFPRHDPQSLIRAAGTSPEAASREGLRRLIEALDADSRLTMFGRLSLRFDAVRLLRNAQLVEDTLAARPALAAAPVAAPIFILGLPRSGTSFLHALLANDPENLVPRNWQTIYPAPRPADFDATRDKRARTVEKQLRFFAGLAPGFADHHPVDADSPQECSEITACVFQSLRFDTTYRVPKYLAWMDAHGHDEAFAFHRRFLQAMQADLPARNWVLKCPDHTFSLDAIVKTYPDARFVVVHRDPVAVFGSVAHLTEILRKPFVKNVDPVEIGHQVTERWIDGAARLMAFDRRDDVAAARKFHIRYEALVADPLAAVARIYAQFGRELAPGAAAAMAASLAAKPRGGYAGQRHYALHKFGISPEALAPRFAGYLDYFGIAAGVKSKGRRYFFEKK